MRVGAAVTGNEPRNIAGKEPVVSRIRAFNANNASLKGLGALLTVQNGDGGLNMAIRDEVRLTALLRRDIDIAYRANQRGKAQRTGQIIVACCSAMTAL